ncbi:MAG: prepilin-type N-terminal cleavage/methylation domain-containing protein [Planctomycetota bacterium]
MNHHSVPPRVSRAFTLIELLVVISIIALLIAILLPALGAARRSAQALQSNTQIRGIQQGMFIYSGSNKDLFPGLDKLSAQSDEACTDADRIQSYSSGGTHAGGHVAARYAIGLEDDLFTPDYLISPLEINAEIRAWEQGTVYTETTGTFFSYALPRIQRNPGANQMSPGRAFEWRAEANSAAVAVSDRLLGDGPGGVAVNRGNADTHISLQAADQPGQWTGGVTFNDNHVETLKSSAVEGPLSYAGNKIPDTDNLFSPTKPASQGTVPNEAQDGEQYNAQQIIGPDYDGVFLPNEVNGGPQSTNG